MITFNAVMSRPEELPEEATQPPAIVTPEQDARRAHRREEREELRALQGLPSDPAAPRDPLRQPGELSSAPVRPREPR
jgi:hypothetical protein